MPLDNRLQGPARHRGDADHAILAVHHDAGGGRPVRRTLQYTLHHRGVAELRIGKLKKLPY